MKVRKKYLILTAGLVWLAAGFNVVRIGVIAYEEYKSVIDYLLSALILLVFGSMFFQMSKKHISRIKNYAEDFQSVFSFFDLKSYCIMIFMMTGGIWLRYSGLVSMQFIAVFYTGLGLALFLAGIFFVKQYFHDSAMT